MGGSPRQPATGTHVAQGCRGLATSFVGQILVLFRISCFVLRISTWEVLMDASERRLRRTLTFLRLAAGLLAALVLTLGGAFSYAMFFRKTKLEPEYQARVIAEVERRLAANSEELTGEAQILAAETLPPLGQALYVQAREDYPRYLSRFRGEGGIF